MPLSISQGGTNSVTVPGAQKNLGLQIGVNVQAHVGQITAGTGDPNGVVTGPVGSLFLRTDGGAATTFYVKESGTGNTGWVGK